MGYSKNPSPSVDRIEESAWTAVAAIVLCISSTQEIIVKFRQLFVKPVTPIKPEQDKTGNEPRESAKPTETKNP